MGKLTEVERIEIANQYNTMRAEAIASKYDISLTYVRSIAREYGMVEAKKPAPKTNKMVSSSEISIYDDYISDNIATLSPSELENVLRLRNNKTIRLNAFTHLKMSDAKLNALPPFCMSVAMVNRCAVVNH